MERDSPVLDEADFRKNLRHAFAAKNALSRIHGYTPEQCLLGKSRAVPASLTGDDDAASHALAESDSPEGQWFRDSLQRRESARKAFVQADNDSAFRRALLRRSRPGVLEYEPKDWVLYWRKSRGNNRLERGRWYGPAQAPEAGGVERRAKARLVVLGFEDPGITSIPRDAPTLGKDGRQLLLQLVSSQRWTLLNFDISTAFLKGQGDGRALGLHAPEELQAALGMRNGDQCLLKGGAYGRVDAPILWYRELRKVLEELGFVACPFDGCVFSLVTSGANGKPVVRGILGVHVDDGIGGGDHFFKETLEKLRKHFNFGAYNEHEFDFCGVHYKQWDDGTIEMDQKEYIRKIEPLNVPKSRRQELESEVSEAERQGLRGLCGSIQFAAVHTRPDLAAKVGQLQSAIPRAKVKDLLEANRVLYEGKKHHVCLLIVPIAVQQVTFCAFSDASFATASNLHSRQGTLIFATDRNLAENRKAVVCPMAWSSKKIPRVVTSTLSAEAVALSSTLDRLGFIRVCWEWIKDPSIDWTNPSEVLRSAPPCSAATDCKSVYDVSTKTASPQSGSLDFNKGATLLLFLFFFLLASSLPAPDAVGNAWTRLPIASSCGCGVCLDLS
eukprot:s1744_g4.t1